MSNFLKAFGFLGLLIFVVGCGSSGMTVRGYTEDRPRVDQESQGNAGYMFGPSGSSVQPTAMKTTRKMYVLEVSKPAVGETEAMSSHSSQEAADTGSQRSMSDNPTTGYSTPSLQKLDMDADTPLEQQNASFVDYKVEKDDTLQKISKKFYDSYAQWPKIYEANKDKISDPNHIKPGITIQIPPQN